MSRLRDIVPSARAAKELRDSVLRAVSLVVTDRRWAAPLSAMALGFGLFLGVAIGPGAAGTQATGANPILALVAPEEAESESQNDGEAASEAATSAPPEEEAGGGEGAAYEPSEEAEYAPESLYDETASEEEAEETGDEAASEEEETEETETQDLRGTVVHANTAASSYTMVISGGELVSIHAPKLPLPGTKLAVEATPLDNNTFAEAERERAGTRQRASFRGVVTYVGGDPADPAYTVSGRGSSILVHADSEAELPELGAYATVAAQLAKPTAEDPEEGESTAEEAEEGESTAEEAAPTTEEAADPAAASCVADPALKQPPAPSRIVVQRQLETEPEPATYVDLAGIVSAICPDSGQLLLSADDVRASEEDIALTLPESFKTAKLTTGDSVVATATIEEDGTLTLAGLASDEGAKGAESTSTAQGDLKR